MDSRSPSEATAPDLVDAGALKDDHFSRAPLTTIQTVPLASVFCFYGLLPTGPSMPLRSATAWTIRVPSHSADGPPFVDGQLRVLIAEYLAVVQKRLRRGRRGERWRYGRDRQRKARVRGSRSSWGT